MVFLKKIFPWYPLLILVFTNPLLASEIINTIAGTGTAGYTGDSGLATACKFTGPQAVLLDSSDNIYISDTGNNVVRMISALSGIITTFAGTGTGGYLGDSGLATIAELNAPKGLCFDGFGNLYIADSANNVIRMINSGTITTFAGTGTAGYSGDTGLATAAELNLPHAICMDSSGNFYIADTGNNVIRKITTSTGIISTVVGTGTAGYSGDTGLATAVKLNAPYGIYMDSSNDLYISDYSNNIIRIVYNSSGIINTYIGSILSHPQGLCIDTSNNIYVADTGNNAVRKISTTLGIMTLLGGTSGSSGYSGDTGLAANAQLNNPMGTAVDSSANVYIADTSNNVLRKIHTGTLPGPIITPIIPPGPTQTDYLQGIDQDDPTFFRFDTIRIGAGGDFSGYGPTESNTQKIAITLQPIAGVTPSVNTTITTYATLPTTVTELWIDGNATGFDVVCGTAAGYQLPTPSTYCDIHFDLDASPSAACQWFQSTIASYCNIYIEPNSADPMLLSLLAGLNTTNLLVVGSPTSLGTLGTVGFAIERHPNIPVTSSYNTSLITVGANTVFQGSVHGVSLSSAAYTCTFNKDSDIVDPQLTSSPAIVNFIITSNKNLDLYGCNTPLPTYMATLMGGTCTEIYPVTEPVSLPAIGPHPLLSSQSVNIPPSYFL